MASLRQHHSNCNRGFLGPMFSENPRRGSTSQMCLHKILSIIATVPPPLAAASPLFSGSKNGESSAENDTSGGENKGSGFGFDLNVGLCSSLEMKESLEGDSSGMSSSSTTAGAGGVSAVLGGDRAEKEEKGNGFSENPHIRIEKAEKSLALLIEAAKLIFGEFVGDDESESTQNVSRVSEVQKDEEAAETEANERKLRRRSTAETGGEFEETPSSPPVVRSKRGRTQVLPGKYRDSVLEPLTRLSRTRSSMVPSKRRRR